tara:strand:+ start:321 stop:1142 length:822 start_codon:yes stop_codon:yes gene_type:complete
MISIILPTYNNDKTIFYSVNSILNQTYKNFELIIVNDFSTDNTKEIIQSFNDSRIVYLENDSNFGMTLSIIKGIKNAKGDFIARMDGDDISVPDRLEKQLKYLTKNPNIDLVGSNIIFFTNNKIIGISDLKLYNFKKLNFYTNTVGLPHPTWMAQANFFKNFQYDPKTMTAEDQDLLLRAYHKCQFTLLKEPLLFYRIPEKVNVKYKLRQVYLLFFSRIRHILYHKLFYYFPIILITFITSSFFYILGLKTIKTVTSLNTKYQELFNKITKKY